MPLLGFVFAFVLVAALTLWWRAVVLGVAIATTTNRVVAKNATLLSPLSLHLYHDLVNLLVVSDW